MSRIFVAAAIFFALSACRLPPDTTPLHPLPENGQIFAYDEIVARARAQASVALEAFYVDNWSDIAEAARGLEQTARFLPKTSDPPPRMKDHLVTESVNLRKDAEQLADAAKAKNVNSTIEILQRINIKIRQLRPEPPPAAKTGPAPPVIKEKKSAEK